ncbi:hypothetical protein H4582DRAFT_1197393 [Lactarius indigo]|nr:hypothetical protein H4582DRAFT_1197393 [Lactarius indigo]
MSGSPVVDIRNSFGAAFVGLLVSTALFGLTIAQTWIYFWNYRNRDSRFLKSFIGFVAFLDTSHTVMCAYAIYWYLVLNFGNVESLEDSMWALNLQIILGIIVGCSVELYYARRVYVVSQSLICPILIVVLVVTSSAIGIFFTAKQFSLKQFTSAHSLVWSTYVVLGTVTLGDILVAASMCWSLYRRRTGFARTDSVLVTLMAYSINSGLLTGLLGLATTVSFIVFPSSLIWMAFSWVMSKCYVNSLLAIRDHVRDRSNHGKPDNAYNLSSIRVASGPLSEGGVSVSVHRSTTLDYGRNKSKSDHGELEEPTFEVPKPDAMITPLQSQAQTPEPTAY